MLHSSVDQWVVIFDTCSLINIYDRNKNINCIFKNNCEVVIPPHVFAELDKISKAFQYRGLLYPTADVPPPPPTVEYDSRKELAKKVAKAISSHLPAHLTKRLLTMDMYCLAKEAAETAHIDQSQRSMDADNRILIFTRKVIESIGNKANVLFVTDDHILFNATCYQMGPELVCSSKVWESKVWHEARRIAAPLSGASDKDLLPSNKDAPAQDYSHGPASPKNYQAEDKEPLTPRETPISRHIKVLKSVSEKQIDERLKFWEAKNIPLHDRMLAAYFIYDEKQKLGLKPSCCTHWNGPNDNCWNTAFDDEGDGTTKAYCAFDHKCVFCGDTDHGWYNYEKCGKYRELDEDLQRAKLSYQDQWDMARNTRAVTAAEVRFDPIPGLLPSLPTGTPDSKPNTCLAPPAPVALPSPSFIEKTKEKKTAVNKPLNNLILKCATMPSTKVQVDALFSEKSSNPEHQARKLDIHNHLKRLAFGKDQSQSEEGPYEDFARYLNFRIRFSCSGTQLCQYFNKPQGCTNGKSCGFYHLCLFCESDGHGWCGCPKRAQIQDSIKNLHFDIPSLPTRADPHDVFAQLVDAYGMADSCDPNPEMQKLIADMAAVPKEKLNERLNYYTTNKFFIPRYCSKEFIGRLILADYNAVCYNYNTTFCEAKKCPRKHTCTHCGSDKHGWWGCEKRLNQCLELKSRNISEEALWDMVEEKKRTKK